MNPFSLFLGALCGLSATGALRISQDTLYSPVFGPFPALLAMSAVIGLGLTFEDRLRAAMPPFLDRINPYLLAACAAAVYVGISLLPMDFTFISQEGSILNFILLTVLYAIILGAQIAVVFAPVNALYRERAGQALQTGQFLIGFAAMLAVRPLLAAVLPFRPFEELGLLLVFLAYFLIRPRETAPAPQNAVPAGAKSRKQPATIAPWLLWMLGLPVAGYTFLQGALFGQLMDIAFQPDSWLRLALPALLACAGAGTLTGAWSARKNASTTRNLALMITSVSLFLGMYIYKASIFPSMYLAYFQGLSLDTHYLAILALCALLPAFGIGMYAGALTGEQQHVARPRLIPLVWTLAVATGLVAYILLNAHVPFFAASIVACATALVAAALPFVVSRRQSWPAYAALTICVLAPGLLLLTKKHRFDLLIDPNRFIIRVEKHSAGGRLSMYQNRDYDDPFTAITWNRTNALAMGSRTVHAAIYKLGHIPMFLHPDARSVLVMGWGSGLPIEAVKMHHPRRLVCVEPTDGVTYLVDSLANRFYEKPPTRGVAFHCERPEAYLSRAPERFDVILSPEPLAAPRHTNAIFLEGYYRRVSRCLNDKGLFAQGLSLSRISDANIRRVYGSIARVFPHTQLWVTSADEQSAMACILASNAPLPPLSAGQARFDTLMRNDNVAYHLRLNAVRTWTDLAANCAVDEKDMRAFFREPAPLLESAPPIVSDAADATAIPTLIPAVFAAMREHPERFSSLPDTARQAAVAFNDIRGRVLDANRIAATGDDTTATKRLFQLLQEQPHNAEVRAALAEVLLRRSMIFISEQQYAASVPLLNEVMKLVPLNTLVLRQLMIASMQAGDKYTAGTCIDALRRIAPRHAGFRDNQASIRAQQGQLNDALLLYENAITLDPLNENFYINMAALQANVGHVWEAIRILDNAGDQAWYPARAFFFMSKLYADRNRNQFARDALARYFETATPDDQMRADAEAALRSLELTGK
jgi:spermidine synthase